MKTFVRKFSFTLPKGIIFLSIAGFSINVATTMVYSQLPMYLRNVLGVSALQVGMLDGIVECLSHITRILSGTFSDFLRERKMILLAGYGLSFIAKPILIFAGSLGWVFCSQALDRFSNGMQASPRDALVGDLIEKEKRGAGYGFMRSLRTAGSWVGALVAMTLMILFSNNFQMVFALSLIPCSLAIILLYTGVREPKKTASNKHYKLTLKHLKLLNLPYWKLILMASFFEMAHFSESFLSLRAHEVGLKISHMGFVMIVMNVGQFLVSYPLGILSDRFNRKIFLGIGFVMMVLANCFMAVPSNIYYILIGVFLWGAQMGTTQSLFLTMISDTVPKELRGTGFGIFYFITGVCYLISSMLAGHIWDTVGSFYTFLSSGLIAVASFAILFFMIRSKR